MKKIKKPTIKTEKNKNIQNQILITIIREKKTKLKNFLKI